MRFIKITVFACIVILISVSASSFRTIQDKALDNGQTLYFSHCGSCHMLPKPSSLTKQVWESRVLPIMASRMGITYPGFDPLKGLTPEEKEIVAKNNIIPKQPVLTKEEWNQLSQYIIRNAPDEIAIDRSRLTRNAPLEQFVRKDIALQDNSPSLITGLKYNSETHTVWIGDNYQKVYNWQWNQGITQSLTTQSPVVDFTFYQDATYLTEIGKLFPTELNTGSINLLARDKDSIWLPSLHRPVHTQIEDLNNDGIPEIIVCKFGNKIGSLSVYTRRTSAEAYTEQVLLNMPGAIKCFVQDMDGDGEKDIVAMFAQGDESVYIFQQKEDFQFKAKRVLRFPPHFGTTDMVLIDFNKDGLTDMITAHGDNADHSPILKAFHGIRIHLNRGNGKFDEKYFYPVYGSTKVIADDFDKDRDIDIALTAFFPDYNELLNESFVYLENTSRGDHIQFTSFTHQSDLPVKSLTLEKGDIDQDGDMDILLGLFAQTPGGVPDYLDQQWKSSKTGLILFMNQHDQLHK
ncbi:FG-GAP repeat domain-containing protein [Xanthocytophaga flava]|uniref:FG-GAP repeat domain-containing protein n=1 Tax=Xanthocytophaga flava TaxID=3048013 RepID=UPI0028D10442|nr:VCBS repeat-containing protein [Xanthocytophaga flavus]MDJ1471289.1 VCBS repeat-containing protein [Xanthocytophaga flavus]